MRFERRVLAAWVTALAATMAAHCGGSPAGPTPPPVNTPPIVSTPSVSRTQVEAGQAVDVSVTVTDAETPIDQLDYQWSAPRGAFSGTGRSVRWTAPTGGPSPADIALTVAVVERHQGGEHRVTATSPAVHYNDADFELRALADTFLLDFADSTKSAEFCVRNFTDSCPGKAQEIDDIANNNRKLFTMLTERHQITLVQLNSGTFICTAPTGPASCALVVANVDWTFEEKSNGKVGRTIGEAWLTGVYERQQWWLCDSRFFSSSSTLRRPFLH